VKHYTYNQAREVLAKKLMGDKLEEALAALDYHNDLAIERAGLNNSLTPVWTEDELDGITEFVEEK
jgi:hypothetical protein